MKEDHDFLSCHYIINCFSPAAIPTVDNSCSCCYECMCSDLFHKKATPNLVCGLFWVFLRKYIDGRNYNFQCVIIEIQISNFREREPLSVIQSAALSKPQFGKRSFRQKVSNALSFFAAINFRIVCYVFIYAEFLNDFYIYPHFFFYFAYCASAYIFAFFDFPFGNRPMPENVMYEGQIYSVLIFLIKDGSP